MDPMMRFCLPRVYRERAVQLGCTFRAGQRPYRGSPIRISTEPVDDGTAVGFLLDRKLGANGDYAERIRYQRSLLRVEVHGEDVLRQSGFSSIAVNMYRPGQSYAHLSFLLDTEDFFISELDRGSETAFEVLFNTRHDCEVIGLGVASSGLPPIVVVPKTGRHVAYSERCEMGRYVVGLDMAQYLANWAAFFPQPKKTGDQMEVEFIVRLATPEGFIGAREMGEDELALDDRELKRIIERYQITSEPSIESEDRIEFRFRKTITIRKQMIS